MSRLGRIARVNAAVAAWTRAASGPAPRVPVRAALCAVRGWQTRSASDSSSGGGGRKSDEHNGGLLAHTSAAAEEAETETGTEMEGAATSEGVELGRVPPAYALSFTCKKCETRMTRTVSKQAYHNGVVIVTCEGCQSRHLIADNLEWFKSGSWNIEAFLKECGDNDGNVQIVPEEASETAPGVEDAAATADTQDETGASSSAANSTAASGDAKTPTR